MIELDSNNNEWLEESIIEYIENDLDVKQNVIIDILQNRIMDEEFYNDFLRKLKIVYNLGNFKKYKNTYFGIYSKNDYNLLLFIEKDGFRYYLNNDKNTKYSNGTYKIGQKTVIKYYYAEDYKEKTKHNQDLHFGKKIEQIRVLNNLGFQEFEKNKEVTWEYIQDSKTNRRLVINPWGPNSFSNYVEDEYTWRQNGFLLKKIIKKYEDFVPKNDFTNDKNCCLIGIDSEPDSKKICSYGHFICFNGKASDYLNDSLKQEKLYNSNYVQKMLKPLRKLYFYN